MRKSKFSKTQQQAILAQHDGGTSVADLCREHQISAATFYKWKKGHEDTEKEETRRLAELERENARLKKMYRRAEHRPRGTARRLLDAKKVASPRRQEQMIDQIRQQDTSKSVRRCCRVLGFRRQTYYRRKQGHRPDVRDDELAAVLRQACIDHPSGASG